MFTFSNLWGGFNPYHTPEAFENLLKREDLTLEMLLDEECILQETKTNNLKLNQFLNEERLIELIDFIIKVPPAEADKKQGYKFPFVACDMLATDNFKIVNSFFPKPEPEDLEDKDEDEDENEDNEDSEAKPNSSVQPNKKENSFALLDHLFSFVDTEEPVNLTLAGYFNKVLLSLMNKKAPEFLFYIYARERILTNLANHIVSRSISESLLRILAFDVQPLSEPLWIKQRTDVLEYILRKKMVDDSDIEEITNASFILTEMVVKHANMNAGKQILQYLASKGVVSLIFSKLSSTNPTIISGITQLLNHLCTAIAPLEKELMMEKTNSKEAQILGSEVEEDAFYRVFAENLTAVNAYLEPENNEQELNSPIGRAVRSMGVSRLRLVELIAVAIKSEHPTIINKVVETRIFLTMMKLFEAYEFNNMLHNLTEKVFAHVLQGSNERLKISLCEDADLLGFIIKLTGEPDLVYPRNQRKHRKPYLGQLTKLSNIIEKLRESDPYLSKITENTRWTSYVQNYLNPTNDTDKKELGGHCPNKPVPEEDAFNDSTGKGRMNEILKNRIAAFIMSHAKGGPKSPAQLLSGLKTAYQPAEQNQTQSQGDDHDVDEGDDNNEDDNKPNDQEEEQDHGEVDVEEEGAEVEAEEEQEEQEEEQKIEIAEDHPKTSSVPTGGTPEDETTYSSNDGLEDENNSDYTDNKYWKRVEVDEVRAKGILDDYF